MPNKNASAFPQTKSPFFRNFMEIAFNALHKKIAAANERSRARRALHSLDDYLLKDMGISRCDIDRIASRNHPPR